MHPKLSLKRSMVVAAVAGVLSIGVPLVGLSVPAKAAVGAVGRGDRAEASTLDRNGTDPAGPDQYGRTRDERSHQDDRQTPSPRDTNTVTTTCGNGLIVLPTIVVPIAPHTTTVINCDPSRSAGGALWLP